MKRLCATLLLLPLLAQAQEPIAARDAAIATAAMKNVVSNNGTMTLPDGSTVAAVFAKWSINR